MTTLTIRCSTCGARPAVAPGEVLLHTPPPLLVLQGHVASYAFICAACSHLAVEAADLRTIALLRTAGVAPPGRPAPDRAGPAAPAPPPGPGDAPARSAARAERARPRTAPEGERP